jgi:hypothetical protein
MIIDNYTPPPYGHPLYIRGGVMKEALLLKQWGVMRKPSS